MNAVFPVGDAFLEIVSPVQEGTTAGRLLDKHGGDYGYMVIMQLSDLEAARARLDGLGVRVVWKADLRDAAGTHLHPKDVGGTILSLDWMDPPESWRWAGPDWEQHVRTDVVSGLSGRHRRRRGSGGDGEPVGRRVRRRRVGSRDRARPRHVDLVRAERAAARTTACAASPSRRPTAVVPARPRASAASRCAFA